MFFSDAGTISFPGLGIGDFDPPTGFVIPFINIEIKFYAVIIAFGLLLAVIYCMRRAKQFGLTSDDIIDVVLVAIVPAIIGARVYYVIPKWDDFFGPNNNWYDCLNIRKGGLAIYGGLIAAMLAATVFCLTSKKRRRKLLPYLDIASLGFLIGQAVGRWGNFFNREAYGYETDNFLRMGLKFENGYQIFVHPTFLYESVWNIVGLILLHFISKKRKFDGQILLCYIAWYGLGRAFIEGLRTDSLPAGSFRLSQIVAAVSCVVAVGILIYVLAFKRPDPQKMLVNRVAAERKAESEEKTEE